MALVMGFHQVALRCPDCKAVVPIEVELRTVRTHMSEAEATTLRLKLIAKWITGATSPPSSMVRGDPVFEWLFEWGAFRDPGMSGGAGGRRLLGVARSTDRKSVV